jgi:hypothetical protein
MSGVVLGGWEFVAAAYTVTALVLGGYTLSVLLRHRAERRRAQRERAFER